MYIKHVFTAALTRWLHSVLVGAGPGLSYLISSKLSITTNPNMSKGWEWHRRDYACTIRPLRSGGRTPKIIQWLSLILLPESGPELVKLKISAFSSKIRSWPNIYTISLSLSLHIRMIVSSRLITRIWWLMSNNTFTALTSGAQATGARIIKG